jgi:ABC-type sugar transport system permease subunit
MKSDKSRKRFVFLCVAPATILFFIFMILPTLNVFRMSLYERGAYSPNETFVGLKNFQHLLKDTQFIRSMQNMILLVVVVTIITFAFALVFAAILTREKIKGQNFFRIIFYIPNILSVVVHQHRAGYAFRIAGKVFYFGSRSKLTARLDSFIKYGRKIGTAGIDSGRVSCRT